jgi:hypothetical protein
MGGRGSGGKSKRQPTDAEIANEVDRDTLSPPPTEQAPTDPPPADEAEKPWWDETKSSKNWSPETVAWDTKLYDTLQTLGGRDENGYAHWIQLADLRPLLGGTREEQDANLKRLSRDRVIGIAPDSARMLLRQEDHDAALILGGEVQHQVQWEFAVYPDRPEAAP